MRLRGRVASALGRLDHSAAAVVFTVPEARLREMDVETGPCVPIGGRKRPLVGVMRQDGAESPEHTAALYTALTGRPTNDAMTILASKRSGRLSVCSTDFVDAMADANELLLRLSGEDKHRGDQGLTSFTAQYQRYADAWLEAAPPPQVNTWNRLTARMGWAREARERGHRLYVWHGPRVPERRVVIGRGAAPRG